MTPSWNADRWGEHLERAAKAGAINLAKLGTAKSAPNKVLLAAVLKHTTDVSNRWLCEHLAMGKPASVSQFVRRFVIAGGTKTAAYRRIVSAVKT